MISLGRGSATPGKARGEKGVLKHFFWKGEREKFREQNPEAGNGSLIEEKARLNNKRLNLNLEPKCMGRVAD